jgi:hypothetical protein
MGGAIEMVVQLGHKFLVGYVRESARKYKVKRYLGFLSR